MKEFFEKNKTIVILIIVACVAYFLWKRSRSTSDSSKETGFSVTESVDAILSAIGASTNEKAKIKAVVNQINASPEWKDSVEDKADNNGYTFEQQAVLDAIWMKGRAADENGEFKWVSDRWAELLLKVKNL